MDFNQIRKFASNGVLGLINLQKAQVGSNGYGFVYFDFSDESIDPDFKKSSGKVCGAGAHFGDFERFMTLDEIKFDKLSDIGGLVRDIKHDLLLAGSLKTLLPDLEFGNNEMLFNTLMFVLTPEGLFFPATFYYGASGTALGGWYSEDYNIFPKKTRNEFNFSPFDLDKDGLTGLIEAQMFALKKVPISDFCGIYKHDLGSSLMCVHKGVAIVMELGYHYEYEEYEVKLVLESHGYDFKQDKFKYREMVKEAKKRPWEV